MLCKLAVRNLKKSVKDYSIYFFTLVLGVTVFYLFNAIKTQTIMLELSDHQMSTVNIMNNTLSSVSVFVSIVLGCLIIYANNYLIKRRKKEFGVYLTLGSSKGSMSRMLLVETFLIGLVSMVAGLILGVFLSQFTSVVVSKVFEADMSKYTFSISVPAIIKTIICFGLIYIFVLFFNVIAIGKYKLIDLLYGDKKSENMRLRNPLIGMIVFIISAIILIKVYSDVGFHFEKVDTKVKLLFLLVRGGLGTFGVFWSLSGMMLTVSQRMKGFYFRKLNSFVLRQFSSKINTMVISMTIICLMLFTTVCILSSSLSLAKLKNDNIRELVPADMCMIKSLDEDHQSAEEYLSQKGIDVDSDFSEKAVGYCYKDTSLKMEKMLSGKVSPEEQRSLGIEMDKPEFIIPVSEYNKVSEMYGKPTFELAEDEYVVSANYKGVIELRNESLKEGLEITVNGRTLKPKFDKCHDGFLMMSENHANYGNIIVPDSVCSEDMKTSSFIVANYTKDETRANELEELLDNIYHDQDSYRVGAIILTNIKIHENATGLSVLATFLGLYLGIIFLITSAAVLALKELSESSDNVDRYTVLRRIGADERMINNALFRQIGMFFAFPMIVAIVHSIFGLKYIVSVLKNLGNESIGTSVIVTFAIIICVYGGYFLLTYMAGKRIIKQP